MIPSKIREILFYSLGAALIGGFVYLYASRFSFIAFRTPALNLFLRLGPNWAIAINAGVFILFLLFLPYRRSIAWRSKGAFAAFILALMAEMFGVPLLLFIFSPLLPAFIPDRTLRLQLYEWLGQSGQSMVNAIGAVLGAWLTLAGMLLVMIGWSQIHRAVGLVNSGVYRYIRHPQYTGLFLILTGWVIHWPTALALLMYPILILIYYRLARLEERDMTAVWGEQYLRYLKSTSMFFPTKKTA